MDDELRGLKARGTAALLVAAAAVTFLGLAGPIALVTTGEIASVLPFYPPGWALAIGCYLYWLRGFRRAARLRAACDQKAVSPDAATRDPA